MDSHQFNTYTLSDGSQSATSTAPAALPTCPIQAAVETAAAIASTTASAQTSIHHHQRPSSSSITGGSHIISENPANVGHSGGDIAGSIVVGVALGGPVNLVPERVAACNVAPASVAGTSYPCSSVAPNLHHVPYLPPQQPRNQLLLTASSVPGAVIAPPVPHATSVPPLPSAAAATTTSNASGVGHQISQAQTLTSTMTFHPYTQMVNGTAPLQPPAIAVGNQAMGNNVVLHQQQLGQQLQLHQPPLQTPFFPSHAQMLKRRAGKWTTEEEDYAEILIELFEKGQVYDEKNGVTLRSFLSRKLFCAPMRISKKYAGKGIGKKVFMSKVNSPFIDASKPHPPELYSNFARMKEAEMKFLRVAFPELQALLVRNSSIFTTFQHSFENDWNNVSLALSRSLSQFPFIPGPFISCTQRPVFSIGMTSPPLLTVAPTVPQPIAPKVGHSAPIQIATSTFSSHHIPPTSQPPAFVQESVPNAAAMAVSTQELIPQHHALSLSAVTSIDFPSNRYSNGAIKNTKPKDFLATTDPQNTSYGGAAEQTDGSNSTELLCLPPTPALAPIPEATGAMQRLHEAYVNSILKKATSVADDKSSSSAVDSMSEATRNPSSNNDSEKTSIHGHIETSSHRQEGLPDFLSGFDEVSSHKLYDPTNGDRDPYSPTYTTESFDNLHQFLGKNLTPLTTERPPSKESNVACKEGVPKPDIPRMEVSSSKVSRKRIPQSHLEMRPLKRGEKLGFSVDEATTDGEMTSHHTGAFSNSSELNHSVDSYHYLFANESSQYFLGQQNERDALLGNNLDNIESSAAFPSNRSTPAPVSDPSDMASDDVNSVNENGNFGDLDETHSEGSSHRTKKIETSGDDDDVRSWYKSLVQD